MREQPRESLPGRVVAPIADATLERLHQGKITDASAIRRLLHAFERGRVPLRRSLNRKILPERAVVEKVGAQEILLQTYDFDERTAALGYWGLSGTLDGRPYFFVVPKYEQLDAEKFRAGLPAVVYQVERRDRVRTSCGADQQPRHVRVHSVHGQVAEGEVEDYSPGGLGLLMSSRALQELGELRAVEFLDGPTAGNHVRAEIRNAARLESRPGWQRIGVAVRRVEVGADVHIERRANLGAGSVISRAANRIAIVASAMRAASLPVRGNRKGDTVNVVEFVNQQGEQIRGILDFCGELRGAPIVVIPPAWGKTKETLLPLAHTIIASFEKAGSSVAVLRFDGIRRKGESYVDPECRFPGSEYYRFTFSQGVKDIRATLDFLFGPSGIDPSAVVLVSFSAASIDARRAVALECDGRIAGWVSVVGAPDLQSAMRVVSGGIDYVGGFERGVRFGLQEIQGVTVDMDHAAADAIDNRLGFMDDALEDMASISTPITWIHGRYDAWMDFERVKMLMGAGETSGRKLVEVPTGHQLRSSIEAIEVFQLIAAEVGKMVGAPNVVGAVPNASRLRNQARAERSRLPKPRFEPRQFWRDYLVGRGGCLGIELMTGTSAYRDLMKTQVEALGLHAGQRIADLGSGTGSLSAYLLRESPRLGVSVCELDCVLDALQRSRVRLAETTEPSAVRVAPVVCNLELTEGSLRIPLSDEAVDAVLASLLISYLGQQSLFLKEARRILRPGGRLVLSTLRPDADTSGIYSRGAEELRSGRARVLFGERDEAMLTESLNSFMNDAARLLDLEEQAVFRFFDQEELRGLLEEAGFEVMGVSLAFGDPPQAIVVSARKPK